jgi:ribonuclease-3
VLSNERLEFLGDAVLGLVICEALYERFPEYLEGDLTKIKSVLVSRRTCAKVIKKLGLQEFLEVGKGMNGSRAITGSLSAALLEALVAAVYQDGGLAAAKEFVLRGFNSMIEQADAKQSHGNYKSLLQQHSQQRLGVTPVYHLLDEKGPDHNKCFEVEAVISDRSFESGWGTNKKEAEQKAAYNALMELGILHEHSED